MKSRKRKSTFRLTAFLLFLSMLLSTVAVFPSYSVTADQVTEETVSEPKSEKIETIETIKTEERALDEITQELISDDSLLFQYVDAVEFQKAGHVKRLPEEEDLNSYVFENEDGTRTAYILAEPVKYIDSMGKVLEKNLTLSAGKIANAGLMASSVSTDAYTVTATNTPMTFPHDLSQGVRFTYGAYTVTLRPETVRASVVAAQADGKVLYRNAFGSTAHLAYTPQMNGLKEDIVLARYSGINSFSFILNTDGLIPASDTGGYYLWDGRNTEMKIRLGQVVSYDAEGDFSIGEMAVQPIGGTNYRVTLTVDEDFLENAVYPVSVDPTFTVIDGEISNSAIEDIVIFEGKPNSTYTSMQYNTVGYADATLLEGRTAFRLAGIYNHAVFNDPSHYEITSAEFHVWGYGSATQTVTLHPLSGNTAWTESNATWNNIGTYGEAVGSVTVNGYAEAVFDITDLVHGWQEEMYNPHAGFLLVGNALVSKKIYSCENTTTAKRPYAVVEYEYIVTPGPSGDILYLKESKELTLSAPSDAQSVTWTATPVGVISFGETTRNSDEFSVTVTGESLDEVTVTATVLQADNTVSDIVFDPFYVVLRDGAYLIESLQTHLSGDYYLRPNKLPTVTDTAPPVYASTNIYGGLENSLFCYWRIQYESNGQYAIRSMANEKCVLWHNNESIIIVEENNTQSCLWIIQSNSNSFRLKPADVNNGQGLVFSASPAISDSNGEYTYYYESPKLVAYDDMAFENWMLTPTSIEGIVFRNEEQGTLCTTFTATTDIEADRFKIFELGYEVLAFSGANTPVITWSCQLNPGIVDIFSFNGEITPRQIGLSRLMASITVGDITYTRSFTVVVESRSISVGIQNNNEYYIMNVATDTYLSLARESYEDGTDVITAPVKNDVAFWRVIKKPDSRVQLISDYSNTEKVLSVGDSGVNIFTNTNESNQYFTIERINDGSGLYYIRYGSLFLTQDVNNSICFTVTVSDSVKWSFMDIDKESVQLYNFRYYNENLNPQVFSTIATEEEFVAGFEDAGYQTEVHFNGTSGNSYSNLQSGSTDIFVFFGHGNNSRIVFTDDDGDTTGRIAVGTLEGYGNYYIDDLPNNSLKHLRCVFYLGCKTGNNLDNTELNLVDETYNKGAHFVLGLTRSVLASSVDEWIKYFLISFQNSDNNLYQILEDADANSGYTSVKNENGNTELVQEFPAHCIGDTYQYLN